MYHAYYVSSFHSLFLFFSVMHVSVFMPFGHCSVSKQFLKHAKVVWVLNGFDTPDQFNTRKNQGIKVGLDLIPKGFEPRSYSVKTFRKTTIPPLLVKKSTALKIPHYGNCYKIAEMKLTHSFTNTHSFIENLLNIKISILPLEIHKFYGRSVLLTNGFEMFCSNDSEGRKNEKKTIFNFNLPKFI